MQFPWHGCGLETTSTATRMGCLVEGYSDHSFSSGCARYDESFTPKQMTDANTKADDLSTERKPSCEAEQGGFDSN